MPQIANKRMFKHRVLKAFRLSIIVGLSVAFIVLSGLKYKHDDEWLGNDIEIIGNIFGNRSAAALVFNDAETANKNLRAARFHQSIDLLCLYDKTGKLFTHYDVNTTNKVCKLWEEGPGSKRSQRENSLMAIVIARSIIEQDELLGHITIYSNKNGILESLLKFGFTLLFVFVGLWLIMSFTIKRALAKIMLPLEELSDTAKDIAFHKLYETRAQKLSEDEIGELVEVFNQMLDSIAEENRALIQSESRFRSLTNGSPVGIFQRDVDGKILYANDKWYEITGLNRESTDKFQNNILDDYKRQYENSWKDMSERSGTQINEFSYKNPITENIQSFMEYTSALYDSETSVEGYIGTLLDVSELKDAQVELEKLAFYDPLTNLPNRRFFRDHLNYIVADAKRNMLNIAILMLDLDNFKKVNDSLGHDTGDNLLEIIADRMQAIVPESCVLSRMGGDEFLFLLVDVSADEAAVIGQKILDTISEPIDISGHVLEISGSIGVAMYPDDGVTSHDLIKNADMALYNAKDKGRKQVNFYSRELDKHIKENLRLEGKLRKSINNQEFCVYLQPFYSTQQEKNVWAEALLRWPDKDEGFIPPDRFIPLAESLGVIHKLGRFVITEVCNHLTTHKYYLEKSGIDGISVNLSALEFFSRNFLPEVRSILRDTKVDPTKLEFEITESIVMGDTENAIQIMQSLRDLGCRLSIDDFGTGYSSLSYLKRFPITSLKIDRSFVTDIPSDKNDIEICTAIIAMAHKLGLAVVAEGVETAAQRDFLIEQGCELLQGYLFSRPEDINEFIKRGRNNTIRSIK